MLRLLPLFCFWLLARPSLSEGVTQQFLRAMEGTPESNQRELHHKLGECKGDCTSDDDCAGPLVCYQRDAGDRVPVCCPGKNRESAKDWCVTRECADRTDDREDDDPYWDFDDDFFLKIKPCEPGCESDSDCYNQYICFARNFGDQLPLCCRGTGDRIDNDHNYCGVKSCNEEGSGGLCFSGETQVHGSSGNLIPMKDLKVGDQVLTHNSQGEMVYQPVYAFAHRHESNPTQFVQIQTKLVGAEKRKKAVSHPLEVTREHLMYVQGKDKPVRAETIQVGDILQGISAQDHMVTKIKSIGRNGLYAPLTRSGIIVVADGIVASNYIAVQEAQQENDEGYVRLPWIGSLPFLHQVDVAHMWLSPFRIFCGKLEACQSFNREGLLQYASWGISLDQVMEQKSLWAQLLVLIPVMAILGVFTTIEHVLDAPLETLAMAAVSLVAAAVYRRWNVVVQAEKKKMKAC